MKTGLEDLDDGSIGEGCMRFEIHDGQTDDYVIITGTTLVEICEKAKKEVNKRRWKDCWSTEVM